MKDAGKEEIEAALASLDEMKKQNKDSFLMGLQRLLDNLDSVTPSELNTFTQELAAARTAMTNEVEKLVKLRYATK